MKIVEDKFLTTIMGHSCYNIILESEVEDLSNISSFLSWLNIKGWTVFCSLNVSHFQAAKYKDTLYAYGFEFITATVTYKHSFNGGRTFYHLLKRGGEDLRKQQAISIEDQIDCVEIARTSFIYDRFHLDSRINKHKADMIKSYWVYNYLTSKRGESLFVYRVSGKIVGFLASYSKGTTDGTIGVIDLIAVDSKYRGQGIATMLVNTFLYEYSYCPYVIVGTQTTNLPSIRLYDSRAFFVDQITYNTHLHLGGMH